MLNNSFYIMQYLYDRNSCEIKTEIQKYVKFHFSIVKYDPDFCSIALAVTMYYNWLSLVMASPCFYCL